MKLLSALSFILLHAAAAEATELIMVEQTGCHWCARWNEEIGGAYHLTEEGQKAPLRRVDLRSLPEDLNFSTAPRFTPTFVVFDGGNEIGRIEGYPGADFFYPLLDVVLARLPKRDGS